MNDGVQILIKKARKMLAPPAKQRPSAWAEENVIIPPPQTENPGLVSFTGIEYCREIVDDFGDYTVRDSVSCFGSQTGKTTSYMIGLAWCIVNDPCGFLWVLPNKEISREFSETRWVPIIDSTPVLADLKPVGRERGRFKKTQQKIGGAQIVFVGSNSPANLSSRPARRVILDEVDKFDEGGRGEADALNLAEQRTKKFSLPQRFKSSTPTLETGIIWQEFKKGDQRRYFIPCKGCGKRVVLAWSKNYNSFQKTGLEAYAVWDDVKKANGDWDLYRVERSSRYECPHCGFHIRDDHRHWMNRNGIWIKTVDNAPAQFISRHLPSLYGVTPESNVGRLAVKFLQAKNSLLGLQGFINGDLAEPYNSQDTMQDRIELITSILDVSEVDDKLLTIDCQERSPFFWYTLRIWKPDSTVAVMVGSADTWEELRAVQLKHGVKDTGVIVDSGYGARADADVYANCARYSNWVDMPDGRRLAIGWTPSKGMPGRKRWRHKGRDSTLPWFLGSVDPYAKSSASGSCIMNLFEFSGDYFKDVLASLRTGKFMPKWSVSDDVNQEFYWHHMDGEVKKAVFNSRTGFTTHEWQKRSKRWPNHLLDCEVLQVAYACFLGIIDLNRISMEVKNAK